jgi:O-acetyl-ADP-ribose deacetylase (regulator of RNase III)
MRIRAIKHCEITNESADALIYSTNVMLNCSGGVGSSLVMRYGTHIQSDLHSILKDSGRRFAERGEVFQLVSHGMPYRAVFHAVACDGWYQTTPEVITSILRHCLARCTGMPEVRSVAMSALATGYGRLAFEDFFRIAAPVINEPEFDSIESIAICLSDESRFHDARRCVLDEKLPLQVLFTPTPP